MDGVAPADSPSKGETHHENNFHENIKIKEEKDAVITTSDVDAKASDGQESTSHLDEAKEGILL
jgi:hypothetical protein